MSPSNSLLDNRYYNKLEANRLKAQAIRSDNISSQNPSYLFSLLLENATFVRTNTGGNLIFKPDNLNENVIQFTDRPFRQQSKITLNNFIRFFITNRGTNNFKEDPPNGVLVHAEEQRTYIIRLITGDSVNNNLIFNLELLPGESHNETSVSGQMSLFVDGTQSISAQYRRASPASDEARSDDRLNRGTELREYQTQQREAEGEADAAEGEGDVILDELEEVLEVVVL